MSLLQPAQNFASFRELQCKGALVIREASQSTGSAALEGCWNHTTHSTHAMRVQSTIDAEKETLLAFGGFDLLGFFFVVVPEPQFFLLSIWDFSFMFFIHLWKINFN